MMEKDAMMTQSNAHGTERTSPMDDTHVRVDGKASNDLAPKIGNPARNTLAVAGITHLDQLTQRTEKEIAALHGMGPKALGLLRAALAERGLAFADDAKTPDLRQP
jgi:DNA-directed RNA polymerase alpha subunit